MTKLTITVSIMLKIMLVAHGIWMLMFSLLMFRSPGRFPKNWNLEKKNTSPPSKAIATPTTIKIFPIFSKFTTLLYLKSIFF